MIHYPHEGGTLIISLLSKIWESFTSFSSLTITAILLDFIVRFCQLKIVNLVFNKRIALFFGLWAILATPVLIPWGTVNFGLHYISSLFPFILLLILTKKYQLSKHFILAGLFIGIAISFSYVNIILLPPFFIYLIIKRVKIKLWGYFLIAFVTVILIHIIIRVNLDPGFHLTQYGLTSIRGTGFTLADTDLLNRFISIPKLLSNGLIGLPENNSQEYYLRILLYAAFAITLISIFFNRKYNPFSKTQIYVMLILGSFLIAYTLSPFYSNQLNPSYVYLRHLTYILPLVALLVIITLAYVKLKHYFIFIFILLSSTQSLLLFSYSKNEQTSMSIKASGWILATKFGHSPKYIQSIIEITPKSKETLLIGVGWGTSCSIFMNEKKPSNFNGDKIDYIVNLYFSYNTEYRDYLMEGIEHSFNENVTPTLNKSILNRIKKEIKIRSKV